MDVEQRETEAARLRVQARRAVVKMMTELEGGYLSQVDGPNNSSLEFWQVRGRVVVIQFWDDGGFEYYLAGRKTTVDEIQADIAYYVTGTSE